MDNILEISNCFNVMQLRQICSLVEEHNDMTYKFRTSPSVARKVVPNDFMQDSSVFIHRFFSAVTINGKITKIIDPYNKDLYPIDVLELFEKKISSVLDKPISINRLSLNIQPANNKFTNKVCPPHVDRTDPHHTALFYINDCDGSTVIYNEKCTGDEFSTPEKILETLKNKKMTIKKEIKSEKNKLVIFDGLQYHSSRPSTSEYRYVINVNFAFMDA